MAAVYITIMNWKPKNFLWVSVFISQAFLVGMAVYIQNYRSKYFPGCDSTDDTTTECTQPASIGNLLRLFFIFLYVMAFIYGIMVICLFKD